MTPYDYRKIPLHLVDVPQRRIRGERPERVEVMAKDIAVNGQLQPILVVEMEDGRFALDNGALRVLAMRANKADEIDARVTKAAWLTPAQRTLRGLMMDLDRDDFTALERCEALYTLKQAYEEIYPETKKGGDRKSQAAKNKAKNQTAIFAIRSEAAEATGLSDRAIRLAVAIFTGLSLVSKERLRGTWIEKKQSELKALSEVSANLQQPVLDLLLCEPPQAFSVAEAILLAEGRKPAGAEEKAYRAVIEKLSRDRTLRRAVFREYAADFRKFAEEDGWFA